MTINVCKDCQSRSPACWGSCKKYIKARQKLTAINAERNKQYERSHIIGSIQYNGLKKSKKGRD